MKLLIVLLVISFFLLLLYWRMRPYIHAVQKAFRVVRQMQEGARGGLGDLRPRNVDASQSVRPDNRHLIKCTGCGTWVPEGRSVTPAGQQCGAYCSHSCAEESKAALKAAREV